MEISPRIKKLCEPTPTVLGKFTHENTNKDCNHFHESLDQRESIVFFFKMERFLSK